MYICSHTGDDEKMRLIYTAITYSISVYFFSMHLTECFSLKDRERKCIRKKKTDKYPGQSTDLLIQPIADAET